MGGTQSIEYSVAVSQAKEGETPIYRAPNFKQKLFEAPNQQLNTMKKILINSGKVFKQRECLGTIVRKQDQSSSINTITYGEVLNMAIQVGSGLIHQGLFASDVENNMNFVGIFARNRVEWTIADIACALYRIVTIPIYDTLGDQNITYVLKHTGITTCFVSDKSIESLIKTHDFVNLKTLVSFDKISAENIKKIQDKGARIIDFQSLIKIGHENKVDYNDPKYQVKPMDCLTFSYTSGTTGPPKGAMLSHKNLASFCAAVSQHKDLNFNKDDVILSYLPLPHVLQRQLLYGCLYTGAKIVYYSGDVQKIKDDLALVKPTIFVSVPRLFNRFHDVIKAKFNDIPEGWTKSALNHGLSVKMNNVSTNGGFTHRVYDRIFFNKTKEALGGRVRLMISGSAPLLPEVHKFLKVVMCAPLIEAYGQTESTGGSTATDAYDFEVSHIGGPVANCQYKLADIPQMSYTSKDVNQQKQLRPRGQICLRGPCVFLGYYKDPKKTAQTIDKDGWLLTGDVGAILPHNKALKIIDRKKNIFKLQQGEYVAPEKVEGVYAKSPIIAEIFVHGDSTETFAIAIATPHRKQLINLAKGLGIEGTFEELCQNQAIRSQILTELDGLGKKAGLQSFEQAKNIYLEPQGFLIKGIVTNTMKIQRHQGRKIYLNEIKALYTEGFLPTKKEKK